MRLITGARYALKRGAEVVQRHAGDLGHQPVSRSSTAPGASRGCPPAARAHPLTTSYPSSSLASQLRNLLPVRAAGRHPWRRSLRPPLRRSRRPMRPSARSFLASDTRTTRSSRAASASSASLVPSLLPSSTYTIFPRGVPSSRSTAVRRRWSSAIVAASLKSGTTIDRWHATWGRAGSSITRHDEGSCLRIMKGRDGST